ncbi:3'-5' exoribonuclease YhaM family protein [Patulibacter americanus]|uniref:3'-5' exoribonuclease YhaM family protein n=1 Tax=Patulibacter americanus TaxID=588672 RepID=UPI0003B76D46|nr:HD domain-containing protein [Patulibacter americanus]
MELRELEHGSAVDHVLLVRGADRRTRKGSDDVFLRLELADRTGSVVAMVWDDCESVEQVAVKGQAVRVTGRFEVHDRFGRQIQLDRLTAIPQDEVDLSTLVEGPSEPVATLEARFFALVQRTQDVWLRRLLERVFARDGAFWPRFRMAPAAKHFHEAYPHGLLDHTLRVAEGVEAMAPLFAPVDRDVAVCGALLHDIGKAHTYTTDPVSPELTDLGRLEGHIVIGYEIVRRVVGDLPGFPPETARSLRHIVLSHHGKLDYGSPVVPATREAVLVHHVDDLAARMGSLDRLERGLGPGDEWSGYDRALSGPAYFGPARGAGAPGHAETDPVAGPPVPPPVGAELAGGVDAPEDLSLPASAEAGGPVEEWEPPIDAPVADAPAVDAPVPDAPAPEAAPLAREPDAEPAPADEAPSRAPEPPAQTSLIDHAPSGLGLHAA